MKNLYRRYKISLITNDGITSEENEIIEFILDKINYLTLIIDEYGYNYINSKEEFILRHDEKSETLWVRYQDFWSVLETKYLLQYVDIRDIIKSMVETTYKIKVGTPIASRLYPTLVW
jgi:hypothetical protein